MSFMSQWLDDTRALIATIAEGNSVDQATKDAVAELKTKMNDNDTSDAEVKTAITEILQRLATSTPPTP